MLSLDDDLLLRCADFERAFARSALTLSEVYLVRLQSRWYVCLYTEILTCF